MGNTQFAKKYLFCHIDNNFHLFTHPQTLIPSFDLTLAEENT